MNQSLIKYGTILGAILAGVAFIIHLIGFNDESAVSTSTNIILIFGLALLLRMYRDKEKNGFISYGQCLGAGVVISIFASVLFSMYYYFYLKLNPDVLEKMLDIIYQSYYEAGMDEEQISQMMELLEMFMGPGFYAFSAFFGNVIFGTIISLITSIFTKRNNPNPFDTIDS